MQARKELKKNPWLTIAIAAYNIEDYIEDCLLSIQRQVNEEGDRIEIIVVEDHSTDNTLRNIKAIKNRGFSTINIIEHKKNMGLSAVRNTALDHSNGGYIWFIDGDDWIAPQSIRKLRAIVEENNADLILCDFEMRRLKTKLKHKIRGELHKKTYPWESNQLQDNAPRLLAGVFKNGHMHTWTKIAKRELWGSDLRFPIGAFFEDIATTPKLLMRAKNFYYVDQPWVIYRQRQGSILKTMTPEKALSMLSAFNGQSENIVRFLSQEKIRGDYLNEYIISISHAFIGASKHIPKDDYTTRAMLLDLFLRHSNKTKWGALYAHLKMWRISRLIRLNYHINLCQKEKL